MGVGRAGDTVTITEKNPNAVPRRAAHVDTDPVGLVGGPGHGFINPVEGIQNVRAHPPADGELINRADRGVRSQVDTAPRREFAGCAKERVMGGSFPDDLGGVDQSSVISPERVYDGFVALIGLIKGVVDHQVCPSRKGAECEENQRR